MLSKQQLVNIRRFLEPDLYKLCDANKTENFDNPNRRRIICRNSKQNCWPAKDVMKITPKDDQINVYD